MFGNSVSDCDDGLQGLQDTVNSSSISRSAFVKNPQMVIGSYKLLSTCHSTHRTLHNALKSTEHPTHCHPAQPIPICIHVNAAYQLNYKLPSFPNPAGTAAAGPRMPAYQSLISSPKIGRGYAAALLRKHINSHQGRAASTCMG